VVQLKALEVRTHKHRRKLRKLLVTCTATLCYSTEQPASLLRSVHPASCYCSRSLSLLLFRRSQSDNFVKHCCFFSMCNCIITVAKVNWQLASPNPLWCNRRSGTPWARLIHCALGPQESPVLTGSRSGQPFLCCTIRQDFPSLPPSRRSRIWTPVKHSVPLALKSLRPKQDLEPFGPFCTRKPSEAACRETDRLIDTVVRISCVRYDLIMLLFVVLYCL